MLDKFAIHVPSAVLNDPDALTFYIEKVIPPDAERLCGPVELRRHPLGDFSDYEHIVLVPMMRPAQ